MAANLLNNPEDASASSTRRSDGLNVESSISSITVKARDHLLLISERESLQEILTGLLSQDLQNARLSIQILSGKKIEGVKMGVFRMALNNEDGSEVNIVAKLFVSSDHQMLEQMSKLVLNEAMFNFKVKGQNVKSVKKTLPDGSIAMCAFLPFVKGTSLSNFLCLAEVKSMQRTEKYRLAISLISEIAKEFSTIRARGFAHGDPHSGNVLVKQAVGNIVFIELIDFGLSDSLESRDQTPLHLQTPKRYLPAEFSTAIMPETQLINWVDVAGVGSMGEEILKAFGLLSQVDLNTLITIRRSGSQVDAEKAIIEILNRRKSTSKSLPHLSKQMRTELYFLRLSLIKLQAPTIFYRSENDVMRALIELSQTKSILGVEES